MILKMHRTIQFFSMIVLSISLSGCFDKGDSNDSKTEVINNRTESNGQKVYGANLPEDAPTYLVAVEAAYEPIAFRDENGVVIGFDRDLLGAIGEVEGFRIKLMHQSWNGIFSTLADGSRHIVGSGAGLRDDRLEYMDATDPLYRTREGIWVPKNTPYEELHDLKGRAISVQENTGLFKRLVALNITDEENVKGYPTTYLAMRALLAGEVDAFYGGHNNTALRNLPPGEYPVGAKFIPNDARRGIVVYYVDKGNTALLNKLNRGLEKIRANGTYAEISLKWLGTKDTFDDNF